MRGQGPLRAPREDPVLFPAASHFCRAEISPALSIPVPTWLTGQTGQSLFFFSMSHSMWGPPQPGMEPAPPTHTHTPALEICKSQEKPLSRAQERELQFPLPEMLPAAPTTAPEYPQDFLPHFLQVPAQTSLIREAFPRQLIKQHLPRAILHPSNLQPHLTWISFSVFPSLCARM